MKEFKSPISRLARLFKNSRDNWKEQAIKKQKKLRALEIKARDLAASREQWKNRAREAEAQLRQLKVAEQSEPKKGDLSALSLKLERLSRPEN